MSTRGIVPLALGATAVLTVLGFLLTLDRVPTPWPDSQLYASIARSRQLYGIGVPSVNWFSPLAVDHLPFYGPVYFDLVAQSYHFFGFSLAASRVAGLFGALVIAIAAALLARSLSRSWTHAVVAVALVLLTPEVGVSATNGTMETLAVGFELMALAVFVRGLVADRDALTHGMAAGALLTLAMLTTPRTYPFVAAMIVSGVVFSIGQGARPARTQIIAASGALALGLCVWAVRVHGSPLQWLKYVTYILLREDTDVAWLDTAVRRWSFSWSAMITPAWSVAASLVAAARMRDRAAWFALLTTAMAGGLTFSGMNITWTLGVYFALPFFAVVIALPWELYMPRRLVIAGVAVLLVPVLAVAALKYARTAATWAARDPEPIGAFVERHVPPGAAVVGPDALYFFAVEGAGARYRSPFEASMADWARWVPSFDPTAAGAARDVSMTAPAGRFLIWQAGDELPAGYSCAAAHQVGLFTPPPHYLDRLGRWGGVWDTGYPETALYRLPPGCPTGYDPTGPGE